jgi:hypothetical protein
MRADLSRDEELFELLRASTLITNDNVLVDLGITSQVDQFGAARTDIAISPLSDAVLHALLLPAVSQHKLDTNVVGLVGAQHAVHLVCSVVRLHN